MKATITSLLTAGLLGLVALVTARPFDAADLIAIAFAAGLVAWTVDQYSSKERDIRPLGKTVAFGSGTVPVRVSTRTDRIAA